MKELTEEILNKYIDGELSNKELDEFKSFIDNNPEALKKLKAHKTVDQYLRGMEADPAPANFTNSLMSKIKSVKKESKKISYFFLTTISIFTISIFTTLVLLVVNTKPETNNSVGLTLYKQFEDFIISQVKNLDFSTGGSNLLFIGGFLTFILLVSAFFMVDSHKSFKQKLNNFS